MVKRTRRQPVPIPQTFTVRMHLAFEARPDDATMNWLFDRLEDAEILSGGHLTRLASTWPVARRIRPRSAIAAACWPAVPRPR